MLLVDVAAGGCFYWRMLLAPVSRVLHQAVLAPNSGNVSLGTLGSAVTGHVVGKGGCLGGSTGNSST